MFGSIGKIFGSDTVIKKTVEIIDEAFYTDSEKPEDRQEMQKFKAAHKIKLMDSFSPFKVAQRVIAFGFVFVFLFVMINGILSAMYGIVPIENVDRARSFANKMYLSEIIMMIVTFYFSGGLVESFKRKIL